MASVILMVNPKSVYPIWPDWDEFRDFEETGAFDQKCINVGLLAVASYLEAQGERVEVIDLQAEPHDTEELVAAAERITPTHVGISCNSCYAYPKLKEYVAVLKERAPHIIVFTGGQHVGPIAHQAMQEIPQLDAVVRYEGEGPALEIVRKPMSQWQAPGIVYRQDGVLQATPDRRLAAPWEELPYLQWSMYPGFEEMVPNIEVSRGCRWGCSFCTNHFMFGCRSRTKSPARILDEIHHTLRSYRRSDIYIYLGAMTFDLCDDNLSDLVSLLRRSKVEFKWRTESRVDVLSASDVEELRRVGLEAVDWGLDGCDQTILGIMHKCKNPQEYLAKAIDLMTRLKDSEVITKINLMFYPGESPSTIRNTIDFLLRHSDLIDILSAKPTMLYPGTVLERSLPDLKRKYGTSKVSGNFWHSVHAYPLHPSLQISYSQVRHLAVILEKMFNRFEKYYRNRLSFGLGKMDLDAESYLRQAVACSDPRDLRFEVPSQDSFKR